MSQIVSSAASLVQARRDLFVRWNAVERVWQDERARKFFHEYLEPIDPALRRACDAISEMSATIDRAMRECE